jgi:hypothetical protein
VEAAGLDASACGKASRRRAVSPADKGDKAQQAARQTKATRQTKGTAGRILFRAHCGPDPGLRTGQEHSVS